MAGVGKKILSLFIEMEEPPEVNEEKRPVTAQKELPSFEQKPSTPDSAISVNAPLGVTDEVIAKSLADALEKANMSGFDYFEYAKMVDALKATIPAEQTLYQTAFTSGVVMGANKKLLIDSAHHYLSVLEKEAGKFDGTVRERVDETVKGKETELASIDASIQDKAEQIRILTDEINALTARKTAVTNELSENKIRIEKVKNDFQTTLQVFVTRIKGDMEKIDKYING